MVFGDGHAGVCQPVALCAFAGDAWGGAKKFFGAVKQVDQFKLDVAKLLGHLRGGWGCCVTHDVRPFGWVSSR